MNPVVVRAIEAFLTYFVVTFVTLAYGLLGSVDVSNHTALVSALSMAALGALLAALKHATGVTALTVKPPKV